MFFYPCCQGSVGLLILHKIEERKENNCISFLDTVTTRVHDRIQVSVYRKPTHTDKYLDFNSHHPAQHKRSVVNTLLDRAKNMPSTGAG